MVVKFSETQLIELRSVAVVPTAVDFLAFTKAIEEQRQVQAELETSQPGRRRSSVNGARPKFQFTRKPREKKEAPKPDEDGWVTLTKKKSSFGAEEGEKQKETFKSQIKDQSVNKIKANSKKMASSSGGSNRDLIDNSKSKFNAFAALNSEDEDESEEEEEN